LDRFSYRQQEYDFSVVSYDAANHVHAFEAVCVTVQYQMDKGGEIFAA
jgi:hypothetical protein